MLRRRVAGGQRQVGKDSALLAFHSDPSPLSLTWSGSRPFRGQALIKFSVVVGPVDCLCNSDPPGMEETDDHHTASGSRSGKELFILGEHPLVCVLEVG